MHGLILCSNTSFLVGQTQHYTKGKSPLDHLQRAAQCYATAVRTSPKEVNGHLGLGLVMEEFFYAKDMYGLKRDVSIYSTQVPYM